MKSISKTVLTLILLWMAAGASALTPTVVVSGLSPPQPGYVLGVDGNYLYFTNAASGSFNLYRIPKSSAGLTLATLPAPNPIIPAVLDTRGITDMAFDATYFYFHAAGSNYGYISRVPKDLSVGPTTLVATSTMIGVNGSDMYFTDGFIEKINVLDPNPNDWQTVSLNSYFLRQRVVDANSIYFTNGTIPSSIWRFDFATKAETQLATIPAEGTLFIDDTTIYFTPGYTGGYGVFSLPKQGGTVTTLVPGTNGAVGYAAGGGFVYYVENSILYAVPSAGGTPTPLASPVDVHDMFYDNGTLYWGPAAGTAIYSLDVSSIIAPPPVNPPNFALTPTVLNFGLVKVRSTSTTQTVSLTNTGGSGLSITALTLVGANALDFKISNNSCVGSISQAGCSFNVSFNPVMTSLEAAHIAITSNAITTLNNVDLLGTGASAGQIGRFGSGPTPTTQLGLYSALTSSPQVTYPPTPLPSTDRKALNSVLADAANAEVQNIISGSSSDACYESTIDAVRSKANQAFIKAGLVEVASDVYTIAAITGITTGSVVGDILINFTAGTTLGALAGQPIGASVAASLVDTGGQFAKYALGKLVTDYIAAGGAVVIDGFDQFVQGQVKNAFIYEGVFTWGLSGTNCSGTFCSQIAQDSGNQADFTAQLVYDPYSHYISASIVSTCKVISTGALVGHKAYFIAQQIGPTPSVSAFIPINSMIQINVVELP